MLELNQEETPGELYIWNVISLPLNVGSSHYWFYFLHDNIVLKGSQTLNLIHILTV